MLLARFRRAGLRTEVQRFSVPGRGRSRNVIGIRDTPRDCLRVVMAHTDTTPNAPGANDNASGLGVVGALGAPRRGVERALLAAARVSRVSVSWVRDSGSGNSDHREFELLGMPAAKLGVGAGGEPCRHSPCDTAGRLDPHSLRLARRFAERALRAR